MIIVRIPYRTTKLRGVRLGLAISKWCIRNGLRDGIDYSWYVASLSNEVRFQMSSQAESLASMLILKWAV